MMSMPLSRRVSTTARCALAVAVLGLLAAGPALAKKSDRQQEMHATAKTFDGFQKPNSVSTLTGNVVITQGTLKVTGSLAKIYFDADSKISRVVITGSPAHMQQLDENNNLVLGDAATLDYDNIKGIAVLLGNASVVEKGRGEAHGDKLTYNTETSQMTGESGGDGLVHMTFKPRPKAAAPSNAPAASAPSITTPPAAATSAASAPSAATPTTTTPTPGQH